MMDYILQTPMYGRREDTDTVNDETFGFLENSNDDRSDQERKRRGKYNLFSKMLSTVLIWSWRSNEGCLVHWFSLLHSGCGLLPVVLTSGDMLRLLT